MSLFYALFFCMVSCLCSSEAIWGSDCCLKINSPAPRLHVKHVAGCTVQKAGLCPFDAILIKTRKGQTFCYDPQTAWVKKHIVMKKPDSCTIRPKKPKNKKEAGRGGKGIKRKLTQEKAKQSKVSS